MPVKRRTFMLALEDAWKWVQIGACIAVGYYIVRGIGVAALLLAEWIS